MGAVHRIRLRGAWRVERADDGAAVFERAFGAPRALDPGECVWLVCESAPGSGAVVVNGRPIGAAVSGCPFAGDMTAVMRARNTVRFELAGVGGAALGEVRVEFRAEPPAPSCYNNRDPAHEFPA